MHYNFILLYALLKKVRLCLYTPWRHIGGVEVLLHLFSALALGGGVWSTWCPGCFNPWGKKSWYPFE